MRRVLRGARADPRALEAMMLPKRQMSYLIKNHYNLELAEVDRLEALVANRRARGFNVNRLRVRLKDALQRLRAAIRKPPHRLPIED
jgi:hypothetical protein